MAERITKERLKQMLDESPAMMHTQSYGTLFEMARQLLAYRESGALEALECYAACSDGCTCGDGCDHDTAQGALDKFTRLGGYR